MLTHSRFFLIFALIMAFVLLAVPVKAIYDPPIFSCANPVGTLSSDFTDGEHGIPGDPTLYRGSDRVYQIDNDHVLQCYCNNQLGDGWQSNWWRVGGLSSGDIEYFKRRGWVYIPSGQPWGLTSDPYLVKNDRMDCQGRGIGGGNPVIGSVLGVSSLAETGNTATIALYLIGATVFGFSTYKLASFKTKA